MLQASPDNCSAPALCREALAEGGRRPTRDELEATWEICRTSKWYRCTSMRIRRFRVLPQVAAGYRRDHGRVSHHRGAHDRERRRCTGHRVGDCSGAVPRSLRRRSAALSRAPASAWKSEVPMGFSLAAPKTEHSFRLCEQRERLAKLAVKCDSADPHLSTTHTESAQTPMVTTGQLRPLGIRDCVAHSSRSRTSDTMASHWRA
jgi:hypothetical protein